MARRKGNKREQQVAKNKAKKEGTKKEEEELETDRKGSNEVVSEKKTELNRSGSSGSSNSTSSNKNNSDENDGTATTSDGDDSKKEEEKSKDDKNEPCAVVSSSMRESKQKKKKRNSTSSSVSNSSNNSTGAAEQAPSKKRSRGADKDGSSISKSTVVPTVAAAFAAICQLENHPANVGGCSWLPALQSILTSLTLTTTTDSTSANVIDKYLNQAAVQAAAQKAVLETPPYVHLSARDSAPQLKMDDARLTLNPNKGSNSNNNNDTNNNNNTNSTHVNASYIMRGYRMSRASHGVSSGLSYYECTIQDPLSCSSFPTNNTCTLGSVLQNHLLNNDNHIHNDNDNTYHNTNNTNNNVVKIGHTRIGWSMRTAELQAPVGYDRWSYGVRDIHGSKIHDSKREDRWGGIPFGPGDVVGFAICLLTPAQLQQQKQQQHRNTMSLSNHIRFFKNGEPMGNFIISKGIRSGGAAFEHIQPGTFYPAISIYMGASVKVNFGPHFIYPPRKLLPVINRQTSNSSKFTLQPISEVCPPPPTPDTLWNDYIKWDKKHSSSSGDSTNKKMDDNIVKAFREAVFTEATIRYEYYQSFMKKHLDTVKAARQQRNLTINDLPSIPEKSSSDGEKS